MRKQPQSGIYCYEHCMHIGATLKISIYASGRTISEFCIVSTVGFRFKGLV